MPRRPPQPDIDVDEIQGDVLPGFRRDHQAFLFARIDKSEMAKQTLARLLPRVSTARDVWRIRQLEDQARQANRQPRPFDGAWVNVAFTSAGIRRLLGGRYAGLDDESFAAGLPPRRGTGRKNPLGSRSTADWKVGPDGRQPHVLINAASDDRSRLEEEVAEIQAVLEGQGLKVFFEDRGDTIAIRPRTEHFGFVDGISAPVFRGNIDGEPLGSDAGRRPLLSPGLLLVGRRYRSSSDRPLAPWSWMANGSYMVWLRLQQDVYEFWSFCAKGARRVQSAWSTHDRRFEVTAEDFAALLIGRRPDAVGTPLSRCPLGSRLVTLPPGALNDFSYTERTRAAGQYPGVPADLSGRRCPQSAHIRKTNPRRAEDRDRVIVRRGIPFGPPVKNLHWVTPAERDVPRGLHFVCYQRSITEQFEHIQAMWVNEQWQPERASGYDPMAGARAFEDMVDLVLQNPRGANAARIGMLNTWVLPTGGAYFFVPSMTALRTKFSS
jgi:Dyp-type peroxidase family